MAYGKLEEGSLTLAPKMLNIGGYHVYNPSGEQYEANGYKAVTFTEEPEAPQGYYYESGWEEEQDEIVQTWTLVKEPDDVEPEEALAILLGGEE